MAEQVGKFLTELPELETPTDGDLMYIVDDETTSKKVTMANLKRVLGGNVTGTVEGASVSFSDGADGIPMEECEVTIVPTQDLHGYSKPWAGGAGKNKLPLIISDIKSINTSGTWSGNTYTINGMTFEIIADDNNILGIKANGTPSAHSFFGMSGTYDANSYIFNGCPSGGANNTYRCDLRDSIGGASIVGGIDTGSGFTFTLTETKTGYYNIRIENGYTADNLIFYPMIRTSGDATFEPYSNICPISGHTDVTVTVASTSGGSGEDTTVSLGRTVYGGTLNLDTGELTVDKGFKIYTGDSSENWIYTSSLNRVYINIADAFRPTLAIAIISNLLHESLNRPEDYGAYINDQGNLVVYAPTTITSASDWKTWLTSNNIEVVYELATPQTFNLTPTQVLTLLGQNYVSHDGGGNIKVVYIRDLDITINDLINRVTALENE